MIGILSDNYLVKAVSIAEKMKKVKTDVNPIISKNRYFLKNPLEGGKGLIFLQGSIENSGNSEPYKIIDIKDKIPERKNKIAERHIPAIRTVCNSLSISHNRTYSKILWATQEFRKTLIKSNKARYKNNKNNSSHFLSIFSKIAIALIPLSLFFPSYGYRNDRLTNPLTSIWPVIIYGSSLFLMVLKGTLRGFISKIILYAIDINPTAAPSPLPPLRGER